MEEYHNKNIGNDAIDDLFRSRLQQHEETEPLHLWEAIDQKRSFGHKVLNQVRLKWFYGIPILAVLCGFVWLNNTDNGSQFAFKDKVKNQTIVSKQAGLSLANKQIASTEVPKAVNLADEIAVVETQTLTGEDGYDEKGVNVETSLAFDENAINESVENQAINSTELTPATKSTNQTQVSEVIQPIQSTLIEKAELTGETQTRKTTQATQAAKTIQETKAPLETKITEETKETVSPEFVMNKMSPVELLNRKNFNAKIAGSPDQGCADFGGKRSRVYLTVDVLASPDYSLKRMKERSSEVVDYINQRENTETFLYGFSGGVRVSAVGPRLSFRTGLIFSQINERLDVMERIVDDEREVEVNDTIINGLDTTFVTGVVTVTETRNITQKTYNYYRGLDIPFLIGYNLKKGRTMDLGINGGAFLNIWTQRKGEILNPSLAPIDISGEEYFKSTIGLSVYAGLEMAYHLNYNLDVLIEPNVRYNMQPFTNGDYPVIQRYWTGALALGVRYKFN